MRLSVECQARQGRMTGLQSVSWHTASWQGSPRGALGPRGAVTADQSLGDFCTIRGLLDGQPVIFFGLKCHPNEPFPRERPRPERDICGQRREISYGLGDTGQYRRGTPYCGIQTPRCNASGPAGRSFR